MKVTCMNTAVLLAVNKIFVLFKVSSSMIQMACISVSYDYIILLFTSLILLKSLI